MKLLQEWIDFTEYVKTLPYFTELFALLDD